MSMVYWVLGGLFALFVFTVGGIIVVDRFIEPRLNSRRSANDPTSSSHASE